MRGETRAPPLLGAACGFQSTPLMRGETPISLPSISAFGFQSTPLMRGETTTWRNSSAAKWISIHSPHARGDLVEHKLPLHREISIHSPHARGDCRCYNPVLRYPKFQSTPLMRGETHGGGGAGIAVPISIHSPHARGDLPAGMDKARPEIISIHSPHARGDSINL